MPKRSRSYKVGLYERLQNDEEAIMYAQVALEDSVAAFLMALRHIAEARQISWVAETAELDRTNLYRMLSETGNPRLNSLITLLDVLGMQLSVQPKAVAPDHDHADATPCL